MADDANVDRVRPNPLRWVAYAYGAGLPPRYRTWVLHDVTTRTWVLRHITRSIVQFAPFAIVLFSSSPSTASNSSSVRRTDSRHGARRDDQ